MAPGPVYKVGCHLNFPEDSKDSEKEYIIKIFSKNDVLLTSFPVKIGNTSSVFTGYTYAIRFINWINEYRVNLYARIEELDIPSFVVVTLTQIKNTTTNTGNVLLYGSEKYDSIALVKIDGPPVRAEQL